MKNVFIETVEACPVCKSVPEMRMVSSDNHGGFNLMLVCSKIMFKNHKGMKCVVGTTAEETAKKWNRMIKNMTSDSVVKKNRSKER